MVATQTKPIQGYSLIELVLVLGVMTVLFSMALPSMTGVVTESRRSSAANLLAADLNRARIEAITRSRVVVVCPTGDGWTCIGGDDWSQGWLTFVDSNDNRQLDPGEEILRYTQSGQPQLKISGNPGRTRIRFLPNGGSYGSNSSWTMCATEQPGNERGIVLSNAGRLRHTRSPTAAAKARCHALGAS